MTCKPACACPPKKTLWSRIKKIFRRDAVACACGGAGAFALTHAGCVAGPALAAAGVAAAPALGIAFAAAASVGGLYLWHRSAAGRRARPLTRIFMIAATGAGLTLAVWLHHGRAHAEGRGPVVTCAPATTR